MISNNFNTSVIILRQTNVGTHIQRDLKWSTLATVSGLLSQLSGTETVRNEGNKIDADYLLYLSITDITTDDRIKIGSIYYSIYRVHNPNLMNRHLEIYLKELPSGATVEV
jgi:head-tail adaptor